MKFIPRLIKLVFSLLLIAACSTQVPPEPVVVVPITVVDESMLEGAIAEALTGTASSSVALTETALAVAGITRTPSPTNTATPLPPSATPTRFVPPTSTFTPSPTETPSITPFPTNTPPVEVVPVAGQIRVIHAWRSEDSLPVDVFIDDMPIALGLDTGEFTPYLGVGENRTVRVLIIPPANRRFDSALNQQIVTQADPIVDQLVTVPEGGSVSVILMDTDEGQIALVVEEDLSSLSTGQSRVSFAHAHPDLIRVDVVDAERQLSLVQDIGWGEWVGPFDLNNGQLIVELADTDFPDQILVPPVSASLDSHVNYLLVLMPGLDYLRTTFSTEMLVIPTGTRMTQTDIPLRIVNAAPNIGPFNVRFQQSFRVTGLPVGEMTVPLPFSNEGGELLIIDMNERVVGRLQMPDWRDGANARTEKIMLVVDLPPEDIDEDARDPERVSLQVFERLPRSSSVLANLRLLHGLTGATQTLDLDIRATNPEQIDNPIGVPQITQSDLAWSRIAQTIGFGEASPYITRASNIFDVQVVLSSTGGVQATLSRLALLPGGVYDILAVPGAGVGVTRLLVVQPDPQISILGARQGDPEVVEAIVQATLTAAAPNVTATQSVAISPTPTISPVPTNTPRPSNTPRVKPPSLAVIPAPPNAAFGSLILNAENLKPNSFYSINLDNGAIAATGRTTAEGTVVTSVELPAALSSGPHVVRLCVDCESGGANQELIAAFVAADPQTTPTPTLER